MKERPAESLEGRFSVCTRAKFLETSAKDCRTLSVELSMAECNLGRGIILLDMFISTSGELTARAPSALGICIEPETESPSLRFQYIFLPFDEMIKHAGEHL